MGSSEQPESLKEVFHKEKKQKKTTDKRSDVNSPLDNSTNVQGSTAVNSISEQLHKHQNRQKSIAHKALEQRERNTKLLANAEIDEHLSEWVNVGLTSQAFVPWVAKCCHTLGLSKVNHLAINARNGKTPDRLFASMLKAAMQLHFKREFNATNDVTEP